MEQKKPIDQESIRFFVILGALTFIFVIAGAWYLNAPDASALWGPLEVQSRR